jgi:hypothetical protein
VIFGSTCVQLNNVMISAFFHTYHYYYCYHHHYHYRTQLWYSFMILGYKIIDRRSAKTGLQVPEVSMTTLNWETPS